MMSCYKILFMCMRLEHINTQNLLLETDKPRFYGRFFFILFIVRHINDKISQNLIYHKNINTASHSSSRCQKCYGTASTLGKKRETEITHIQSYNMMYKTKQLNTRSHINYIIKTSGTVNTVWYITGRMKPGFNWFVSNRDHLSLRHS